MRVDLAPRRPGFPARLHSVDRYGQPVAGVDRREVALYVGAQHPRPVPGQAVEQTEVRVTVPVAHPRRHERDPRVHRIEEGQILVRRTVVGHLEHVGPQRAPAVSVQHGPLFLALGVTGKQDGYAAHPRPKDERVVVGVRPGPAQGVRGTERQDLDVAVAVRPAARDEPHRHGCVGGRRKKGAAAGGWLGEFRSDHGSYPPAAEDARHPVDVIGVQMADHQHRYLAHS
jgi:hypothetical protein